MNIIREEYLKSIRLRPMPDWLEIENFGKRWRIWRQGEFVEQIPQEEKDILGGERVDCYFLFGKIKFERDAVYLAVVTEVQDIGHILYHPVKKTTCLKLIPIRATDKQNMVRRVEKWLSSGHLLFSPTFNLSCNIGGKSPRQNFIFNMGKIDKLEKFHQPCISGAFHNLRFCVSGTEIAQLYIISRRDRRRVGLRWQSRGTDTDGNPSNMIETEFGLIKQSAVTSYIQLRGSVPVPWFQNPDMSFRPKQQLKYTEQRRKKCFNAHIDRLITEYSNVTIVSLLTKSGRQGRLDTEMQRLSEHYASEIGNLDFISYNYNKQTKNNYKSLSLLLARLDHTLKSYSFSSFDSDLTQTAKQKGVIRTNCIDCIDRTGIVQYTIMKVMLHAMFTGEVRTELFDQPMPYHIEEQLRKLWVEHNDQLAIDYTGTEAMKRQIILFGRPMLKTYLRDATIFFRRYWRGNFKDPLDQLAIDTVMRSEERLLPSDNSIDIGRCYLLSYLVFPLFAQWLHVDGKDVGLSGLINIQPCPRFIVFLASVAGVFAAGKILVPWLNKIRQRKSFPFRFK